MLDGMEANRLSARTGIKSIKKIKILWEEPAQQSINNRGQ